MGIIRITKEFHFEMAHALYEHDGPCRHIHGHSYQLSVTVKGEVVNEPGNPGNGMVMDFSVIKAIVQEQIVSKLDHALLLEENAAQAIAAGHSFFQRVIKVSYTPTCENMLFDFVQRIKSKLPRHISLQRVMLRETPTSYAEWCAEDNIPNNGSSH